MLAVVLLAGCDETEQGGKVDAETALEQAAMDWRERRLARLTEPYGWLSLTGLDFVGDGRWQLGSDEAMDVVMPAGPALWGILELAEGEAWFEPESGAGVTVDDQVVERERIFPFDDEPVFVSADEVRFQIVGRGDGLAVRSRWPEAASRKDFVGLDYFPFSADWVIEADFEYNEPGTTILIANVLGDLNNEPSLGRAVFEIDGRSFSLEVVGDETDDEMFIILADRTSGRETYGLGRFLYADAPVDGRIVIDFNRAYNPPCAFNEYTTCSLPPPENRLDVRVEAGELAYQGPAGWRPPDL